MNRISSFFKNIFSQNRASNPVTPQSGRIWFPKVGAGVVVTHDTALNLAAVYAAVKLIAESIGEFPWQTLERTLIGKQKVITSLTPLLLTRPNVETSAMDFKTNLLSSCLMWGNGFAEIIRNNFGDPIALILLLPQNVLVTRDKDGNLIYIVDNNTQNPIPAMNMFHIKTLSTDGGCTGRSVVELARETIGIGLGSEVYSANFIGNSAVPPLYLHTPSGMEEDEVDNLLDGFNEGNQGPHRAGRAAVLQDGVTVSTLSIKPVDFEFLSGQKFNVEQIARWFRVPPHMIQNMEKSAFSNIESQERNFVNSSLLPYIIRMEQEADFKLIKPADRGRLFTKLNVNAKLRADKLERSQTHQIGFMNGFVNVNEIRDFEDMNNIGPEGDVYFRAANLIPLGSTTNPNLLTETETTSQDEPKKIEDTTIKHPFKIIFEAAAKRIVIKECKAIERSTKKYADDAAAFTEWTMSFFNKHRSYFVESMITPVTSLLSMFNINETEAEVICDVYAQRYIENAIQEVNTAIRQDTIAALIEDWLDVKCKEIAEVMMEHAITTTRFAKSEEDTNANN